MVNTKMNLVICGNFLYPKGMACTKRIQHIADELGNKPDMTVSLLLLRQSHVGRDQNRLSGEHRGLSYITIGHDVRLDYRLPISVFRYFADGISFLKRTMVDGVKNILYVYGEPNIENIVFILYAKKHGYKILFDIVEDFYYIGKEPHIFSRIKYRTSLWIRNPIIKLADGVVVISGYLEEKFRRQFGQNIPLHVLPVSIDTELYPESGSGFGSPVKILYAGSFGDKDAIYNLIAAFEQVAKSHGNICLALTGQGTKSHMEKLMSRIESSPVAGKIEYLGFLDDDEYYNTINDCDIPCMVRDSSEYAHAGFPFKLGEYLATGNPTIASDVGDVRKYITGHKDVMLVEPGNVQSIVEALRYLLDNPDEAVEIGRNGRKVAERCFGKRRLCDMLHQYMYTL